MIVRKTLMIGAVAFLPTIVAGCGTTVQTTTDINTTQSSSVNSKNNSMMGPSVNCKNGQYTATGDYISPGGPENLTATLTLENNIITEAQVTISNDHPESKPYHDMFVNNYKTYVVGKNINEVNLTKVSGSSLTPMGFNDALAKIIDQAS